MRGGSNRKGKVTLLEKAVAETGGIIYYIL